MARCSKCKCMKGEYDFIQNDKKMKTCNLCRHKKNQKLSAHKTIPQSSDTTDLDNYLIDEEYLSKSLPNQCKILISYIEQVSEESYDKNKCKHGIIKAKEMIRDLYLIILYL